MNKSIIEAIKRELKAVRDIADAAERAGRDLSADERAKADSHLKKAAEFKKAGEDQDALHQQLKDMSDGIGLRAPDDGEPFGRNRYVPAGTKASSGASWGRKVIDANSDGLRFKGLTPAGSTVVSIPAPLAIESGRPVPTVRSLVPSERSTGAYRFFRQTTRTNNANVVAAGDAKPVSVYETELVDDRCRVVAHLTQSMDRSSFTDGANLGAFVETELFYGLANAVDDQMINGSGVGENMAGLASTSGIQTQSYATSLITTTRKALTKLELFGYSATGWIMNASDWESVELSATTTGSLLVTEAGQAAPIESSSRRLWGVPVVVSPACPQGTAWLADFGSTCLFVQDEARIDWSENTWDPNAFGTGMGAGDFERNQIRFRCEGRFGFAVLRPDAIVRVDMSA